MRDRNSLRQRGWSVLSAGVTLCCSISLSGLLGGCGGAGTSLGGLNSPTLNAPNVAGPNSSGGSGASDDSRKAALAAAASQPRLGVLVSADDAATFGEGYAQAWVTIHKVELLDKSEQAVTIFADDAGRAIDLKALSAGREPALLTAAPLASAAQTHQRVRITFGKGLLLFSNGETVGRAVPLADSLARDAEGRPTLTLSLDRPRNLSSGKERLVLDFDALGVTDDKASVSVKEDTDAASAPSSADRQLATTFTGTVSALSGEGAAQTFLVSGSDGAPVAVEINSDTVLYNADQAASPALADGQRVVVRGVLDSDHNRVAAKRVRIDGTGESTSSRAALVFGTLRQADAGAGTLILSPRQVVGLTPDHAAVTVTLASDAALRSRGGLSLTPEAFWEAAGKASADLLVEVEGDYDPVMATLTARRVKLDDVKSAAHEVVLTGPAKTLDEDGRSLTLGTLVEWDGLAAPSGDKGVTVVTTPATTLAGADGQFIASANLFAAAKEADKTVVRVTGLYADGKVTATRIELRPAPARPVATEGKTDAKATGPAKKPAAESTSRPATKQKEEKSEEATEVKPAPTGETPASPQHDTPPIVPAITF